MSLASAVVCLCEIRRPNPVPPQRHISTTFKARQTTTAALGSASDSLSIFALLQSSFIERTPCKLTRLTCTIGFRVLSIDPPQPPFLLPNRIGRIACVQNMNSATQDDFGPTSLNMGRRVSDDQFASTMVQLLANLCWVDVTWLACNL
jgi:hypothetical protein